MSNFTNIVNNITFSGEEARVFADTILTDAYQNPELNRFHTVMQDIVAKKQIPFLGRMEKLTKADTGCDTVATTKPIVASEKYWDPNPVEIWLEQCAADLEETFMVYLLNRGLNRYDFTATDVYRFLIEIMTEAAVTDVLRQAWFSDTAYVAGDLTGGAGDLPNYNIYDGFWKQLFAIGTANAAQVTDISENDGVSKAAQALAADKAYSTFQSLTEDADTRIYESSDPYILTTRSMIINYKRTLRSKNVPESFSYIQGDPGQLAFDGVPIYEIRQWDRVIKADFDDGTVWDRPHRAVLTSRPNLAVGVDAASALGSFMGWFEKKDKKVNIRGNYKVDVKVLKDYMVQLAY